MRSLLRATPVVFAVTSLTMAAPALAQQAAPPPPAAAPPAAAAPKAAAPQPAAPKAVAVPQAAAPVTSPPPPPPPLPAVIPSGAFAHDIPAAVPPAPPPATATVVVAAPPPPLLPVVVVKPEPTVAATPVAPNVSGISPTKEPTKMTTLSLMSLSDMREKGIITQEEYDSAMHELTETSGRQAPDGVSLLVGKWSTTLYGFVDADAIYDSTGSFNDLAGNSVVSRPGTYLGDNPRTQFSIRNSRLGFLMRAPQFHDVRASARIEMDFLGSNSTPEANSQTVTNGAANAALPSEANFFTSPEPRIRHLFLKVENPIVDALFGQTWHLFGWQDAYHPNTVQYQGVPGELYSRTPQIRLSKTMKSEDVTFDIAVAALRPPQRDSAVPEGAAAIHFALNHWTGVQTQGATGTGIMPASIAVSGDVRSFALPNYNSSASNSDQYTSERACGAIAVDAFIPVIPGDKAHMGNSLSILGEFVDGTGIADLYTGLTGGVGSPSLPSTISAVTTTTNAAGKGAAGVASGTPETIVTTTTPAPLVDPGLVYYDQFPTASGDHTVHFIQWMTIRGGIQYYLPGLDGNMWVSANVAYVASNNDAQFGINPATTLKYMDWFDVNLMGNVTPAVRLGIEYANYSQHYNDEILAVDHRVQGSAFYIF
jgi:hypothetical protein